MASHSEWRWDPEIREHLLRSENPWILALLARDPAPAVAVDLIRRLTSMGQLRLLAKILTLFPSLRHIPLEPMGLLPLLESKIPTVRFAAVTHLGQVSQLRSPASSSRSSGRSVPK